MSGAWHITLAADGADVIEHRSAPGFQALWTSGLDDLAGLSGPCWSDEGHGEADAITLHGFRWEGPTPDQATFEALMREAVTEIDAWIARRL